MVVATFWDRSYTYTLASPMMYSSSSYRLFPLLAWLFVIPTFVMQIEVGIEQSSQSLTIPDATTSGHRLHAPESFHGFGTG